MFIHCAKSGGQIKAIAVGIVDNGGSDGSLVWWGSDVNGVVVMVLLMSTPLSVMLIFATSQILCLCV